MKTSQADRDRAKAWRQANPERHRELARKSLYMLRYRIQIEDYDRMFAEQNGQCFICDKPSPSNRRLAVDHDHATGKARRLLCNWCNNGIGFLENAEWRKKADAYLTAANEGSMK